MKPTYVITGTGTILVQRPDQTSFGFSLHDDDQSWPGGIGCATEWTAIPATDPRITEDHHQRLDHLLSPTID